MKNPIKQILLDIIDFIRFKVDTDSCTLEEMKSAFRLLSEHTITKATTADIAKFYGQSPSNVRNIVSRWGIKGESKRYYDFGKLQQYIPKSWRKAKDVDDEATIIQMYSPEEQYNIAAESETEYGGEGNEWN